jgi:N-acetylneuraminate lyase
MVTQREIQLQRSSAATVSELGVLMAAIVTPMHADEHVNYEALSALIDSHITRGVEGIYCGGSSGEGLLLSLDERAKIVRTALAAANGRVPVVAHVGTLRTQDAVELAQQAESDGAAAVSMIPPIYYAQSAESIADHYRTVMDATVLPMIIYNIPQFTGIEFNAESAGALLADPRVIGVKQTAHNMYALERMKAAFPDKAYINGFDEVFLSALAAGASGTIGTTVGLQIELFAAVRRRFLAGDFEGAQRAQSLINDVVQEIVSVGVFPATKYLAGRSVGDLGSCRKPFPALSSDSKRQLDKLGEKLDRNAAEAIRDS